MEYQKTNYDLTTIFLKKEWTYFHQVYLSGSMSRAAIELNVSQSAISKAILELEDQTKEILFVRSKYGAKATPPADVLFKKIEKIATLVQVPTASTKVHLLKIGCHPSIGTDFFPKTLSELLKSTPINISFKTQTSKRCVADVLNRGLDLALVANPVRHKDLVIRKLSIENIMLFQSEKSAAKFTLIHPDQIGLSKSLRQIKTQNIIELEDYEMIASLVSKYGDVFNCILPEHVAKRYELSASSKTLHRAAICLIYRADHPSLKILRMLA